MKLTKINRSKSFEMVNGYGLKSWDKFGLEADITTGEDPIQLYKELDAIIEQSFKESYPDNPNQERVKQVEAKPVTDEVQAILDGINNSPDLVELKSWWLKSKGNLTLSSAYKIKEKQLTDAK
jgi:3-deoxy-D-manno-octulosonate 8-phosphate phosphatase KdsC-like HAD superfamily phosphatase